MKIEKSKGQLRLAISNVLKEELVADDTDIFELFDVKKRHSDKDIYNRYCARLISVGKTSEDAVKLTDNFFDKLKNFV